MSYLHSSTEEIFLEDACLKSWSLSPFAWSNIRRIRLALLVCSTFSMQNNILTFQNFIGNTKSGKTNRSPFSALWDWKGFSFLPLSNTYQFSEFHKLLLLPCKSLFFANIRNKTGTSPVGTPLKAQSFWKMPRTEKYTNQAFRGQKTLFYNLGNKTQ